MLSLVRKGKIGELKVIKKLLELNLDVYTSVIDDKGIDCIIGKGNKLRTVNIKYAEKSRGTGIVTYRFGNTKHKTNYLICGFNNSFWIIPSNCLTNTEGITLHIESKRSRFNKYKNNWTYLINDLNGIANILQY